MRAIKKISALCPVSLEQVEKVWRGEWIGMPDDDGCTWYECSRCEHDLDNLEEPNHFCPACGAPMTDDAVQMVMERLEALEDEECKMNKPKLCELLGVDVDEEFKFEFLGHVYTNKIKEDGNRWFKSGKTWYLGADERALIFLIKNPERIIREPKWTKQEVEDAKTILRIFGKDGTIRRYDKVTTESYSTLMFNNIYINENLFPGIKEGQEYTLDDIINNEHELNEYETYD